MKENLHIRVTGRVQGVFFRESTRRIAHEYGINGIVRNEPDGSLYIEAEGEKDQLEKFLEWVGKGPPGAQVEKIRKSEEELRHYRDFMIVWTKRGRTSLTY